MTCVRCGSWCAPSDNYCRHCGEKLQALIPAGPPSRSLAVLPAAVPPAVIRTVAAVVAGKALEWAVRRAARGLAGNAGAAVRGLLSTNARAKTPAPAPAQVLPAAGALISEVVVMWREVRHIEEGRTLPPQRR